MLLQDIKEKVDRFVLHNPQNSVSVAESGMIHLYDRPLIGVASADDALWERMKQADAVGSQHFSPQEWLAGARSVISYFLPFSQKISLSNVPGDEPSVEWRYGRYEGGELFNGFLQNFIIDLVHKMGGHAMAPTLDKRFTIANVNLRSNWSERHVAFIAGLGTFSLSRSLITSLGTAGHFVSVIVDLELEPTKRLYQKIDEYCIKCGACIHRCPVRSIAKDGKDNASCACYLQKMSERFTPRGGCGKCQTAVPCEHRNPHRDTKN